MNTCFFKNFNNFFFCTVNVLIVWKLQQQLSNSFPLYWFCLRRHTPSPADEKIVTALNQDAMWLSVVPPPPLNLASCLYLSFSPLRLLALAPRDPSRSLRCACCIYITMPLCVGINHQSFYIKHTPRGYKQIHVLEAMVWSFTRLHSLGSMRK